MGSCPTSDIESNAVCDTITAAQPDIIQIECATAYGQYVYVYKDSLNTEFSLCEIEVYGNEGKHLILWTMKLMLFIAV